jgi:hypothetical protein
MRIVPSVVASLVLLSAAALVRADEPPAEEDLILGQYTCDEFKAMLAEIESRPREEPPPPPPECRAVCVAAQLAACAVTPKACGTMAVVEIAGSETSCICEELKQTPAEPAPR